MRSEDRAPVSADMAGGPPLEGLEREQRDQGQDEQDDGDGGRGGLGAALDLARR